MRGSLRPPAAVRSGGWSSPAEEDGTGSSGGGESDSAASSASDNDTAGGSRRSAGSPGKPHGGALWEHVLVVVCMGSWLSALLHGAIWGPSWLDNLGTGKFDPPEGSQAWMAHQAVLDGMPEKLGDLWPVNMAIWIRADQEAPDQSSMDVCIPAIGDFSREVVGLFNETAKAFVALNGCRVQQGSPLVQMGRSRDFYMTPSGNATMMVVQLDSKDRTSHISDTYSLVEGLCDKWTQPGAALEGFECTVVGEWLYGRTAKKAAVARFAASDGVGVPLALLGLIYVVGLYALLVLVTLPVTVLTCFDMNLQLTLLLPDAYVVPPFAPSLLLSLSVALSLDYTLFIARCYRDELARGSTHRQALATSLASSGRTIFISGFIMVVANFGGLLIPNVSVKSLCISIALCSATTTAVNLTLLPPLLYLVGGPMLRVERHLLRLPLFRCFDRGRRQMKPEATPLSLKARTPSVSGAEELEGGGSTGWHVVFWQRLSAVVTAYPRRILIAVLLMGLPVCLQVTRLQYSVAFTYMVPDDCSAIQKMTEFGSHFPLGLTDTKRALVRPRDPAQLSLKTLPVDECFDDDATVRFSARSMGMGERVTCQQAVKSVGCEYVAGKFTDIGGVEREALLQDYCPHSCPAACTAASVLSRPYYAYVANVTAALEAVTRDFAQRAGLGDAAGKLGLESLSTLDGAPVDFAQAKSYLAAPRWGWRQPAPADSCFGDQCTAKFEEARRGELAKRYQQQFQGLANYDRSKVLLNLLLWLDPFGDPAFRWVDAVYAALQPSVAVETSVGSVVLNDPEGDYEVLFGDVFNDFAASISDIFVSSPLRLACMVVVTVMGASLAAFSSAFIGPRLLATVVFTVTFSLGACVIIFQDARSQPLHWITLLVAVPCMLGLTLDYDIFLLSHCYELRLAGCSTEEAIVKAMQQTGPTITTAGLIMMLAFGLLMFTGIPCLYQMSVLLVLCCFLDAFVVRPLLVPAMMLVMVDYNWWPGKVPPETDKTALRQTSWKSGAEKP